MRLLALALLAISVASAQPSNWAFPTSGATVSLTADHPFLDGDDPFGASTSVWMFETAQPIVPGVRLVGEIPFALVSYDDTDLFGDDISETGASLGNVQLGVEADFPLSPVALGAYLRIPTLTTTDDIAGGLAPFVGVLTEYERIGAYTEDVVTVAGMVQGDYQPLAIPTLALRARLTPEVLIATDDDVLGDDAEVLLGYALQAFVSGGVARFGVGFSGISLLSEADLDERHEISAGLLADVGLGPVLRLGATARIPIIGDLDEVVDGVVGLRLTYRAD